MNPGEQAVALLRLRAGTLARADARVVVEEPLEIRLDGTAAAVTMRTPGSDLELAIGFLITEGVIENAGAIASAVHCDESQNVVDVRTARGARVNPPSPRNTYASSSCGICGKASIDAVRTHAPPLVDTTRVSADTLLRLPARLRCAQPLFDATGSLHAAALFDPEGELIAAREDVGRHNAVDKLVGWAALEERLPLSAHILLVSGRAGFEIVQKAVMARIPIIAAVSGPSSLSIELAREAGATLVTFLRGEELNVCCGEQRIAA